MPRPLPWLNNLSAFASTYLSLSYLTSSGVAYDSISLSRPFIPTLTIKLYFLYFIRLFNFMLIGYYLLYDLYDYILCIILNYKNLQFKQFIDDIVIDL